MTVDTPLALFTTLFGWQFYNTIWDVLLGTGIALLPFVGALIEVFVTDREDGTTIGDSPDGQYKRLEAKVLVMAVVVVVGAQPTDLAGTSLGPDTLTYVPYPTLLEPDPVTVTTSTSDSTFGQTALGEFDDNVPVPIWWYAVMSVSQGINRAVISGFPEVQSIRDLVRLAQIANINDPVLAAEAREFYSVCYIPARSKYERDQVPGIDPDEINFMGSAFYVEGEYQNIRARRKIRGFPFDPARDTDLSQEFDHETGKPFCDDWWLGNGAQGRTGLRGELLEAADATASGFSQGLASLFTELPDAVRPESAEDILIERLLNNSRISFSNESFRTFGGDSTESNIGAAINAAGVNLIGGNLYALFMDVVTLGAPMMQPMVLMGIFALLPFAMVASRYSLSFLVGGAVVIFTVSFWPVLWYMSTWVDDQLTKALFPEDAFVPIDVMRGIESLFGSTKGTLLSMTTASLFVFLPIVFSAVMGMAGLRAAGAAASLTRSLSSGGDGIRAAGSSMRSVGSVAMSKVPLRSKGSKG